MTKSKTLYSPESAKLTQWLREKRDAKQLSMRDLGGILGWHHSIIGKIEQGERRLDVIEFIQICQALDACPHEGINIITE